MVATETGFEPYGAAEVRTGMSVQEFTPISEYRASKAHPARGANKEPNMYDFSDPTFRAIIIGTLISIPFKIVGLWRSARNDQKGWFAAMLLLNTFGVLELTYLFYFSSKSKKKTED